MVAAHPFVITLVDLSFFGGAGKDLTKICFNNHRGIQVAGILIKTAADTYALVSFHHGLMFFAIRFLAWTRTSAGLFLSFCPRALSLSLSLSLPSLADTHTLIHSPIHSFTLLLPSSLRLAAHSKQNGIWRIWKACCSASEYQCTQRRLGPGYWASPISPNWQAVENNNDFHWKTSQTDDLKRNRLHRLGKASGKMWMSTLPKHL